MRRAIATSAGWLGSTATGRRAPRPGAACAGIAARQRGEARRDRRRPGAGARAPRRLRQAMNPEKRREIFARLAAANPHPTTELEYRTPFELLVAVMLSAQATDKSVNLATREAVPGRRIRPQQILALGVEGLIAYIQTIGLYNTKAKNVIAICRLLLERARRRGAARRARRSKRCRASAARRRTWF